MALDLKPFIRALVDLGSEDYEQRVRKMIVFAGVVAVILILVWKRG